MFRFALVLTLLVSDAGMGETMNMPSVGFRLHDTDVRGYDTTDRHPPALRHAARPTARRPIGSGDLDATAATS
jgi:hypothetical protein